MSSLNRCEFIGNLGRDPETRFSQDGKAVTNIAVACGYAYKDKQTGEKVEKIDWINVVAFGRLAEVINDYLHKGSKVFIEGRQTTEKWQDKNGKDQYTTKIIANKMIMLDSRNQNNPAEHHPGAVGQANPTSEPAVDPEFDDAIPF